MDLANVLVAHFLASLGTDTSMTALDIEVNSRQFGSVRRQEGRNGSSDASFSWPNSELWIVM